MINPSADPCPDKIFVRNHFTDFEKLLYAEAEIKELKAQISGLNVEIGKLKSYIDELKQPINPMELTEEERRLRNNGKLRLVNRKLKEENKRLRNDIEMMIVRRLNK